MAARVDGQQRMRLLVFCRSVYHLATPALAARARSESIYKGEKFSGHAPLPFAYEGLI